MPKKVLGINVQPRYSIRVGRCKPEQSAEVFEQACIACYSSLRGIMEKMGSKILILFTFGILGMPLFMVINTLTKDFWPLV